MTEDFPWQDEAHAAGWLSPVEVDQAVAAAIIELEGKINQLEVQIELLHDELQYPDG